MAITLSGDGISSDAIASLAASKLTGVIPDANAPSGSVIQVVQGVLTTTTSTTSTTFITSGLTASITPTSTSSKILVCVNGGKAYIGSNYLLTCALYRNGSAISGPNYTVAEGNPVGTNHSQMYLDSPATTSATTYTVYYRTTNGVGYFSDGPSTWGNTYITLMEIAG
jgi:hypothetical protein